MCRFIFLFLVGGCGAGVAWHGPYSLAGSPSTPFDLTDVIGPPVTAADAKTACDVIDASHYSILATPAALQDGGVSPVLPLWTEGGGVVVAWPGGVDPADSAGAHDYVCMRRRF